MEASGIQHVKDAEDLKLCSVTRAVITFSCFYGVNSQFISAVLRRSKLSSIIAPGLDYFAYICLLLTHAHENVCV